MLHLYHQYRCARTVDYAAARKYAGIFRDGMYAGLWRDSLYTASRIFAPIGEAKLLKIKQARRWRWVALLVTPGDVLLQSVWLHSGFKSGDYWLQNCVWHYGLLRILWCGGFRNAG